MGSIHTQMLPKALALVSLAHRGGGAPIPIFAPGARNPRYATAAREVIYFDTRISDC